MAPDCTPSQFTRSGSTTPPYRQVIVIVGRVWQTPAPSFVRASPRSTRMRIAMRSRYSPYPTLLTAVLALFIGTIAACTSTEPAPAPTANPPPTAIPTAAATATIAPTPSPATPTPEPTPTNTPLPPTATAAPTFTPRPTPTTRPSPSPTPTQGPTRTPRPTSTPRPPNPIASLEGGPRLEANKPALADHLRALSWVADGVDDWERDAAEALIALAVRHREVFDSVMSKRWIQSDINIHEATAIDEIYSVAYHAPILAGAMLEKSWVQDGITRDEAITIDRLESTMRAESESLQQEVIQKVVQILDMPFLDTVESSDALAVSSLERFEDAGSTEFLELMNHPTLSDGIDDEEAKISRIAEGTQTGEARTWCLSCWTIQAFSKKSVPSTFRTPGSVLLAIIRFHDRISPSPNMDYLEHAVRHHEGFMGEPLPTNYVVMVLCGLCFQWTTFGYAHNVESGTRPCHWRVLARAETRGARDGPLLLAGFTGTLAKAARICLSYSPRTRALDALWCTTGSNARCSTPSVRLPTPRRAATSIAVLIC